MSAAMAARSVAWNGVDNRCDVRLGDMRDPTVIEGLGTADLVTGTPPYLPVGTGIISQREQCGPCRFELRGGVEDYALTASKLLAEGAPFIGCAASRQRDRVIAAAQEAGLALESLRDIIPRAGKPPLFTVYVMRRARGCAGLFQDEPPLVLRGEDGRFTPEFDDVRRAMGIPV